METQGRGQLTERIKQRSKELLGYEVTQTELRLMPYAQYTLVNEQRLNPQHLNKEDREILSEWVKQGFILDGVTEKLGRPMLSEGVKFRVTKKFWDIMCELTWFGYVDLIYETEFV